MPVALRSRCPLIAAVAVLSALVLSARGAHAQTDGGETSGYGVSLTTPTPTRSLPTGLAYDTRPANLHPNDINFQDCEDDVTLTFEISEATPSNVGSTDLLEVWAGTTDCTQITAREAPGPFCWQVVPELVPTPGTSVTVAMSARSLTQYIEVNLTSVPGGGGVVGGPNLPESACHTQTSPGPVAIAVYFMFIAPGATTVDASTSYPLAADLVGPLAPTAVSAGIGDGVLIVDWTPQVDPNIQGFYIYAEDQGPKGGGGTVEAGATLENDIYCHSDTEGGSNSYEEVFDAASLAALGEAGWLRGAASEPSPLAPSPLRASTAAPAEVRRS